MDCDEDVPALVIDNGSSGIKAGFAGEVRAKVIGAQRAYMAEAGNRDSYVGDAAQSIRQNIAFKHPIERGLVTDWDNMEKLWHHIFYNELRAAPEERPVLLTEKPLNPRANREKMTQIMFESFKTPAMYVAQQPVLSLYAAGRTSGVVLDSGAGVTHSVVIYDGHACTYTAIRMDLAGQDLDEYVSELVYRRTYPLKPSLEISRDIKEKLCYVALNLEKESENDWELLRVTKSYELPDGTTIALGSERFLATEYIFNPKDRDRVDEMVHKSVTKNYSMAHCCFANIVLAGGNTLFPGFANRLREELTKTVPYKYVVKVIAPPERKYSAWHGGSILGCSTIFQQSCITKAEYDEYGPSVVHKKCF